MIKTIQVFFCLQFYLKNVESNIDKKVKNKTSRINEDFYFDIRKYEPNDELKALIKEGRENLKDKNRVRYNNINEMLKALMND